MTDIIFDIDTTKIKLHDVPAHKLLTTTEARVSFYNESLLIAAEAGINPVIATANALNTIRKSLKITFVELAEKLHLSRNTLSSFFKGKSWSGDTFAKVWSFLISGRVLSASH